MTHTPADLLWPAHDGIAELPAIEAVPLHERGLPATTYDTVLRAAGLWPDHLAAYFHTGGTTGIPKLGAHTHADKVVDP
ncbi:hypothetical protein [Streptomyces sp. NPDC054794]